MVSRVGIKEAQELGLGYRIYNLIDAWESERIFGACFVEISVVNAHAPLPVLLLHQDWVSQPVGVVDFFDEVGSRELSELVSDGLLAVLRESAESLLDWLCSFFDIKSVLDHLPGDTRHVGGFPSEDVLVCLKEGDEHAFLFVIESHPDQSYLGWIGRVEHDI